ncbi:TPA: glycosyltransferase [Klebsiella pneumoniae]|uniref:glycosyltransferase n=1 Tax=Klebsiella pneumoniae TaxID=573 RepID=UPI0020411198|nr:glycosyltransferase [Klebsiella pneumoniae]USC01652.1 glycosyltransferase [Klebsiella pneumoniae]HBT4851198.1 glycosyltransferase [Klebsiella pneumoniae]HBT4857923.1 glycosyltransferase [Klebsiella pneumoniae]HBT4874041.1 glycosyltransferase [Klebsiella pneumoniae]
MNITFFCATFPVASETFIQNQIISFIKMGHNVRILALYPGDMSCLHEDFVNYNLKEKVDYVFPSNFTTQGRLAVLTKRFSHALKCLAAGKVKAFNIIKYGHLSHTLYLPSIIGSIKSVYKADYFVAHFGTCGTIANSLRELGVLDGKIVTIFHGFDISIKDVLARYKKQYSNLFAQGDLFFPISHLWKEKMISLGCEPSKIEVIRMGIHVEEFVYKGRDIKNILNIVSVCRLIEKKGIEYSIRACSRLKENNIPFNYTIVGYGPLESSLRSLIEQLGLTDVVTITGFQSQSNVKAILDKSNVFVLPSITSENGDMEGIPVALMEAMASGLPVVSTYHSGIPELIENNISGYLCDEKNIEQISEKLIFIYNNPQSVLSATVNARTKIEESFNIDIEYNKMTSLMEYHL